MMKKKIIFLDHDGVLCLAHNWGSRKKTKRDFDDFDQECVSILNNILDTFPNIEIVVSSDWRLYEEDLLTMQYHYSEMGVKKFPIDYTPDLSNDKSVRQYKAKMRTKEILQYCQEHQAEIETWVAIDDLELNLPKNFFVKTNTEFGLNEPGILQQVIKNLK
jgi:hypothetical protein